MENQAGSEGRLQLTPRKRLRNTSAQDPRCSTEGPGAKLTTLYRSKEGRAEQNRRAQQAFRRRREEHIKKLESDAALLVPTRERLEETEYKVRDIALVRWSLSYLL